MQKTNKKLNVNPVGANCVRPHFKEMTLKNQKGITLIALIITIIVMLILVGVTINVALNGGIFTKAEQATRQTEEKSILEEMLAMMEIEDNGKFNPDKIIDNMIAKHPEYEIDDSNKPNVTIKGKLGTYKYIVSETEIKIGEIKINHSTDLEKYLFNEDGTGKTGLLTMDEDTDVITFVDDSNTIADASTSILYMNNGSENGEHYVVVEYKGADYKVNVTSVDFATASSTVGSDNEKVTELPTIYDGTDDETKIKQYFLGYSGTGKYFINLIDLNASDMSNGHIVFKGDNIITDASENITILGATQGRGIIQYNGETYVLLLNDYGIIYAAYKNVTTYPIAYELKTVGLIILETDVDEIILTTRGANGGSKGKIVPCTNVFDLKTNDECNRIVNNTGMNDIGYSKAVINENEVFQGIVYSEELYTWIFLTTNKNYNFGVIDNYYSIESDFFFERIELTQAEIDSIIQAANATKE